MPTQRIQALCEAGDFDGAVALVVQHFGGRIYTYLLARTQSALAYSLREQHAQDIYGEFCVDLVRGLPAFEWRCRLESWLYRLAFHALSRFYRHRERRDSRHPARASAISQLAASVAGPSTLLWREERENAWTKLRESLDEIEQDLLIWRIDEELSWEEIANILYDDSDPASLAKNLAALRKRFERTRRKLHRLAVQRGLLPPAGEA
ncbi:MAG: sigma-70 family RNA polymerase sigma factor [Myxococcota bacterium]|jgi:RNA polymerase sigma-70 factor (ECF subfamily)|nr:sigma-70 family RNA polymerase sigma factor [Myxococcota bacterium]